MRAILNTTKIEFKSLLHQNMCLIGVGVDYDKSTIEIGIFLLIVCVRIQVNRTPRSRQG